jgi:hypothetical protein
VNNGCLFIYLLIYFWGGVFGDDFFTTWPKKEILKLGIPQPFYTFLKAHRN